jgi:hypothetical protein
MLTKTELKQLHKEEFIEAMRSTVEICNTNDPKDLQISSFVTALHIMVLGLDDSILYEQGKPLTRELEILDEERDSAITGTRYGFIMFTYHKTPAKKAAAQLLLERLDSYGSGIARMNNESESTILQNFVNDCKTIEKYKKALMLLGLEEWIEDVETANNAFNKKYQQRIQEESDREKKSVTILRPQTVIVYEKLINRIDAHIELDEIGKYQTIYNQLATLKNRYKQIITARNNEHIVEVNNNFIEV